MEIIVSYIIGTIIGMYFGHVMFKKYHIQETIEILIEEKFLRHKIHPDGEVELLKAFDTYEPESVDP